MAMVSYLKKGTIGIRKAECAYDWEYFFCEILKSWNDVIETLIEEIIGIPIMDLKCVLVFWC